MTFTNEQIEALKAPLGSSHVKTRAQAGRQLSYVEGWHAIAEANRIFGFDMWDRRLVTLKEIGEPRQVDGKWRVAYLATVRITVYALETEISRDGTGFGSGIDKDVGQAHESAIKEAETDAMKRALMTFGNPFGLALYDKDQANVVNDTPPPPKPAAVLLSVTASTLIRALNLAETQPALAQWFADNKGTVEGLHEDEKQSVRNAYAAKHTTLKAAA